MDFCDTPPYSTPNTPELQARPPLFTTQPAISTPNSMVQGSVNPTLQIPGNLTQELVNSNPQLKRWQQDLLILTSFLDNSTDIHWRPSWFPQAPFSSKFWSLQNPPNVVTEYLPYHPLGRKVMTRRMRQPGDPAPSVIKTWERWYHYCEMYGIPKDFLCEEQIKLMRLGLPRSSDGRLIEPPTFPLYPEPQPVGQGRYLLDRETYRSLPSKFHEVDLDRIVVVHSNGTLKVPKIEDLYYHASQWTHYDGRGRYIDDFWYDADPTAFLPNSDPDAEPKVQGSGRRWAYVPWTQEQEKSCLNWKLSIRVPSAKKPGNVGQDVSGVEGDSKMGDGPEDIYGEYDSGFHTGEEINAETEDQDIEAEEDDEDMEGDYEDEEMDDRD